MGEKEVYVAILNLPRSCLKDLLMKPSPPCPRLSFSCFAATSIPASLLASSDQWENPSDVFSVLLILGGDVVERALAQLAGSPVTPVAFSFGWVAYAVTAVVSAIGENKLMPLPDCACKVINGRTGYVRDNSSWIIGRIVRDFESWMDDGKPQGPIHIHRSRMLHQRWE